MLIQFNFKNFKSFRDDVSLDFSATSIKEYNDRVIKIGNEKILPVSAIFGANAHGKSNVIEAFQYMDFYVRKSFGFSENKNNQFQKPTPFLFDEDTVDSESHFEVYFIDDDDNAKTYNYGFTISKEGVNEEWLNYKAKSARTYTKIFYRNEKENVLELDKIPKKSRENIKIALGRKALVVSLGAMLQIDIFKHIMNFFDNNIFANFGDSFEDSLLSSNLPEGFKNNEEVRKNVVDYLSAFDDSIIGFEVEEDAQTQPVYSIHKMVDSDKTVKMPLESESAGTLKMFSLYPFLNYILKTGGVLVIDELNSKLHPLLVRAFLITFLNPKINKNHAQILFTSHDAWQLSSNGLRRDEIWFVEKDSKGISTLYSLADFVDEEGSKIRKDANYEKNYLLGKYGAVPTLKDFDMLIDKSNNT